MQVLVGDHVVVDALAVQPVEQMGVGVVLVEGGAVAAQPGVVAAGEVQDRAQAAGVGDAGAVGVAVVEGAAEFGVVVHVEVGMAEREEAVHQRLGTARGDVLAVVGIGDIGAGRGEKGDFRAASRGGMARRADEERQVVLAGRLLVACPGADMQGVGAALEVVGYVEGDRGLPAGVVEVVVVEVDGAVLLGPPCPVVLLAGPVPALHGAGRQVDQQAVAAGRADVDGAGGAHLLEKSHRAITSWSWTKGAFAPSRAR